MVRSSGSSSEYGMMIYGPGTTRAYGQSFDEIYYLVPEELVE